MADTEVEDPCAAEGFTGSVRLRIGAIFIILASSTFATLMPIVTRRVRVLSVPASAFDFAKYFGSGVIIATAFMHLLAPGVEELSSPCLNSDFQNYTFAFAFAMISMFFTFITELLAFRLGSKIAARLAFDPHRGGHHHANEHDHVSPAIAAKHRETELLAESSSSSSSPRPEQDAKPAATETLPRADDLEVHALEGGSADLSAAAREILGVAILEFGVVFHSFIIGLTLATTGDFTILFIVIIFHQMFEGLGLGVRLSLLPVPRSSVIPWLGAIIYSCVTPLGMAIGLGVRTTYNGNSATASYITGTFDSVSAGILLYTGLVELLAHEFIFNEKMRQAPLGKVMINILEVLTGAGIMALLARWA